MRRIIATIPIFIIVQMLSLSGAYAPPALENCNEVSRVCVKANRHVDAGHGITARVPCTQWEKVYLCDRETVRDTCTVLSTEASCRKTGQETQYEHGHSASANLEFVCEQQVHSYIDTSNPTVARFTSPVTSENPNRRYLDLRRQIEASGAVQSGTTPPELISRAWDKSESQCDEQHSQCSRTSGPVCVTPGQTISRVFVDHSEDCWRQTINYTCPTGESDAINDCAELRDNPQCNQISFECLSTNEDGVCLHETFKYVCNGDEADIGVVQECGSQRWCIGEDCTDADRPPPNEGFARAAAAMNLLQEMGRDYDVNGDDVSVFGGDRNTCKKSFFGAHNCCKASGLILDSGLSECSEDEKLLSVKRGAGQAHHVRDYCDNRSLFGTCLSRASEFCTFDSRLARIIQEQGRAQLGINWNDCRGLSTQEIQRIDWSRIDISEVISDIQDRLVVPDPARTKAELNARIQSFYDDHRGEDDDDNASE